MALEAYVQGDITVITQILSQVAMIFDGNVYVSALKAMVMIGIVIGLFSGLAQGARLSIMTFVWPLIIVTFGILPKTDLVFTDPSGGVSKVDDLPIIVAAPISFITRMGYGLTEMIGDNMGIADLSMTIENGAIVSTRAPTIYQRILTDKAAAGTAAALPNGLNVISDPANYVTQCIGYALKSGQRTEEKLMTGNFDSYIGVPDFYFMVAGSNGINYGCQEYYTAITAGITSSAFEVKLRQAINAQFGRYKNDSTTGQKYQDALDRLVANRGNFYKAVIWSNALAVGGADYESPGGGGSTAAALADALNQRLENSRGTAAIMFESIHTTIGFVEAWSLSIMPLMVLVMMLGPMGTKIGGKYLWLLVWIQLWFPCTLIVLGYLDAEARNISYNATSNVTVFMGFMSQLARLQDMGYSQLSMVTMLSMFLIFGASAVFGTALQREMAGGDFYDERKNAPDTLSRAPVHSFSGTWETTPSGGTVGKGSEEAFGGWSFSLDRTVSSGIQSSTSMGQGAQGSIENQRGQEAGSQASKVAAADQSHDVSQAGVTQVTQEKGMRIGGAARIESQSNESAGRTEAIGTTNSLNTNASAAGGASVGLGGGGSGGGSGGTGISAGGNVSAGASKTWTNSTQDTSGHSVAAGIQTGSTIDHQKGVSGAQTESDSITNRTSKRETGAVTETGGESSRNSDTVQKQTSKQETLQDSTSTSSRETIATSRVDARMMANNVAEDREAFSKLAKLAGENGLYPHINQWMANNSNALDKTFKDEESKWAFAALSTMQGLTGKTGLSQEQENYVNAASDDIMRGTRFDLSVDQVAKVNNEGLRKLDPGKDLDGRRVATEAMSRINREGVEDYMNTLNVETDIAKHLEGVKDEAGKSFDQMAGKEVDGIFTNMRNRIDTLAKYTDADGDFTKRRADVGFIGALQSLVVDPDRIRSNAITNEYAEDAGVGSRHSGYAPQATPEEMLNSRLETFRETGNPSAESNPAKYLALAQLAAGATAMANSSGILTSLGDTFSGTSSEEREAVLAAHRTNAEAFTSQMEEMRAADPALAAAAPNLERLALSSASQEGIANRLPQAAQEYGYQREKASVEAEIGREINDHSSDTSWGRGSDIRNMETGDSGEFRVPISYSEHDRDIAIRTVLGEAGGEAEVGKAAVAHVLMNRLVAGSYGESIADVALAKNQFSAWNSAQAGGNHLVSKYGPGSEQYERVGEIVDAVFQGAVADPTGGATNYYSPAGMTKLVDDGFQSNTVPAWAEAKAAESGGVVQIGGHIFMGRS